MLAGGDEPGDVRHVDHEQRVDVVRDLAEALEVDDARIGARAGDDHLWPDLARLDRERVVVDARVVLAHAVRVNLEPLAAEVDRRAVRQVAAVGQVHAQDAVTDVEHGDVRGHVRLRPGVRLHVDVLGARE